jgi:hypothetical protein
LLSSL